MRRRVIVGILAAVLAAVILAQHHSSHLVRWAEAACTNTPNLTLCKPATGDQDIVTRYNENLDKLDAPAKLVVTGAGPHRIDGVLGLGAAPNTRYMVDFGGFGSLAATTAGAAANSWGYVAIRPLSVAPTSGTGDGAILHMAGGSLNPTGASASGSMLTLDAPGKGGAGSFANLATLTITAAPTGGTNNHAIRVASGTVSVGGNLGQATASPAYGTTVTIRADLANAFRITATNGTGFTIANPDGTSSSGTVNAGQQITIMVRNTSGGALGTVTWGTAYKLATWTSPATANSRSISFLYDATNWVEINRTPADVPN